LSANGHGTISVVISTFQRPGACEAALRSALAQTTPPLEVLVCDNGSTDDTEARMRTWEKRDERVRYLRTSQNSGTPGTTRNLGIEHARGELVAFLDDDDEWLPGKLAAQRAAMVAHGADLISTNAFKSNGSVYFPNAPQTGHPKRAELMWANPIIVSSALVARELLLATGGFQTHRRVRGIEDYAMWLELSARGARLLVLGEPLVRYEDASSERMSTARVRTQVLVARLSWAHALRRPIGSAGLRAALRHTAGIAYLMGTEAVAGLRNAAARRR
jgi:glycosyltransferase involved in cell wall biosynthesis